MMAKKLRLDPIMAVALTFFASFTGFAVGPRRISTAQLMMDVPMYSGFVERTVILLVIITIGMLYTLHYARKIAKDPTKSAMGNTDWMETYHAETGDEMEVVAFNPRAALVTVLFFAQVLRDRLHDDRTGHGKYHHARCPDPCGNPLRPDLRTEPG